MKRLSMIWMATAIVVFVLAGWSLGFSADQLSVIKERGKLIVGTSADYPPYESVDPSGKFVGFDMDLVREVGKRMGVSGRDQRHGI